MAGLKRGNDVQVKEKVDYKEVTIQLKKGGDSEKVILLSAIDYVQYDAHNDFGHKIYPQPCLKTLDEKAPCPYCVASKNGMEELKPKTRFKFGFYVVETGTIKFLDTSFGQGKALITEIKEAEEDGDIDDGTVYNLKRTGSGTTTGYTLKMIPAKKLTQADKVALETAKEMSVSDEQFEQVCAPRSYNMTIGILNEAGFPVIEHFEDAEQIVAEYEAGKQEVQTKSEPTEDVGFRP